MANIAVKIENIAEFRKAFQRAPEVVGRELHRAFEKSTSAVQATAKRLVPVDSGRLRDSIETEIRPLEASVFTTLKYAPFVEFGTRPHFPPPQPLDVWARRHGIPLGAVQKKIAREGTPAVPFLGAAKSERENEIIGNFADAITAVERSLEI